MKKNIYFIIILIICIFPITIQADICGFGLTSWTCYPDGDVTMHCITPGPPAAFPSYSTSNCITGGKLYDTLQNSSSTEAAIALIRQGVGNGSVDYITDMEWGSCGSGGNNDNINITISWTEEEFDEKLITETDHIFAKKYILNVKVDGDISGFTFKLTTSVSHNFKLDSNFKETTISLNKEGIFSSEIVVYSDDILINDTSNVELKASITPVKPGSTVIYFGQGGEQYFVGRKTTGPVTLKPKEKSVFFDVTKSCQYRIAYDENGYQEPRYRLHIVTNKQQKTEDQEVDVITYMEKGCCSTVQPKFFNTNTEDGKKALDTYQRICQNKGVVIYEYSCGKNVNNCDKNQNVKPYSISQVLQPSIKKLKELYDLDNINIDDIKVSEDDTRFTQYYDTNLSNDYCKVLTSENNIIYYPTTAVATSGRFFVFQEYNNDECKLGNSSSCFRQPYVKGTINLYVRTDYKKWSKDKDDAEIEYNKLNCEDRQSVNPLNLGRCDELETRLTNLEKDQKQCENIANFNYNLEPQIKFYYEQEYYNGNSKEKKVEEINMVSNATAVKYWPNASTDTLKTSKESYVFKDGVYEATYTKTVYYRPEGYTYSLLPSGTVDTTNEFQDTTTRFEKGISVGYVYNIRSTAYVGVYNTWFDISNLGNGGAKSLLTKVVEEYKAASKRDFEKGITDKYCDTKEWTDKNRKCINYENLEIPGKENDATSLMFRSQCKYCIEEGAFQRECDTCDESDPKFVFRNVSLSNITPNTEEGDRKNEGTNWVDDKGNAAKSDIESASGNGIAVADIKDSDKELLNNNTLESNEKSNIVFTANEGNTNYIYANDAKYLEYDITLTSKDMRKIRANNKNISYDYAEINVCNELSTTSVTKDDSEYCYTCNEDGKECESSFITAYTGNNDSKAPGRKKWKYYFYNPDNPEESTFITGTMASGKVLAALKKIQGNEDGGYPDPENQEGWLNTYKNWP